MLAVMTRSLDAIKWQKCGLILLCESYAKPIDGFVHDICIIVRDTVRSECDGEIKYLLLLYFFLLYEFASLRYLFSIFVVC